MKKKRPEKRLQDVKRSLIHRSAQKKVVRPNSNISNPLSKEWRETNKWIDENLNNGLVFVKSKKRRITLYLPERLDFYSNYDISVIYMTAIRKLATRSKKPKYAYKLASVNFERLKSMSTSAALVLTAELSRWQDSSGQKLTPKTQTWHPDIFRLLDSLGFFELFSRPPLQPQGEVNTNLKFVRYIKGRATETSKTRQLKLSLQQVMADEISKWTFLRSGLDEAITNVSHHAYPKSCKVDDFDKNWYLTGSYEKENNQLKIAFYDQGIGIPRSLPTSGIWEKVIELLSINGEKRLHKTLLKAAVQMDRTSTGQIDRGKGLQDLLTFIEKRGNGYLSILSLKGLFKRTIINGIQKDKSVGFKNEMPGTLIIWSVKLEDK